MANLIPLTPVESLPLNILTSETGNLIAFPKEVECVYEKKYYLTEIAEIINNMGEHKVNIVKNEDGIDDPYCGTSNNLSLKYEGLEKGIRDCYLYYMKVQNRQIDRKYSAHIWK